MKTLPGFEPGLSERGRLFLAITLLLHDGFADNYEYIQTQIYDKLIK